MQNNHLQNLLNTLISRFYPQRFRLETTGNKAQELVFLTRTESEAGKGKPYITHSKAMLYTEHHSTTKFI
jgi:hypothetical protein